MLLKISSYEGWVGRYHDSYQHAVQAYEESITAHREISIQAINCRIGISHALAHLSKADETNRKLCIVDAVSKNGRVDTRDIRIGIAKIKCEFEELCIANGIKETVCQADRSSISDLEEKKKAEVAYQSAVDIRELSGNQQYTSMFALHQEALEFFKFGENSDKGKVVETLERQAHIESDHKNLERCEALYREALREATLTNGDTHPEVFRIKHLLGDLIGFQEKFTEAIEFYTVAAAGRDVIYGLDNPVKMHTNAYLALSLERTDRLVEAECLVDAF